MKSLLYCFFFRSGEAISIYIFLKVKYISESLNEKRANMIIFSDFKADKILEDEKFWALASSALLLNCTKEFITCDTARDPLYSQVIRSCRVSRRQVCRYV